MHTTVVELDTLTDTVGATAQHQYLVALTGRRFAFLFIGGIHVGGRRGELRCAGIDPLVHRPDTQLIAARAHLRFRHRQEYREPFVGEALAFQREHPGAVYFGELHGFQAVLGVDNVFDLHQEPGVDAGQPGYLRKLHTGAEGIGQVPDTVGTRVGQFQHQLIAQLRIIHVDAVAITSPTDFIWVVSRCEAPANFSNAKRGILVTT